MCFEPAVRYTAPRVRCNGLLARGQKIWDGTGRERRDETRQDEKRGARRDKTRRHGTARHGKARQGTARHGTARHGTAPPGRDTTRRDATRRDAKRDATRRDPTRRETRARAWWRSLRPFLPHARGFSRRRVALEGSLLQEGRGNQWNRNPLPQLEPQITS